MFDHFRSAVSMLARFVSGEMFKSIVIKLGIMQAHRLGRSLREDTCNSILLFINKKNGVIMLIEFLIGTTKGVSGGNHFVF